LSVSVRLRNLIRGGLGPTWSGAPLNNNNNNYYYYYYYIFLIRHNRDRNSLLVPAEFQLAFPLVTTHSSTADGSEFESRLGARFFSSLRPYQFWNPTTQPPIQWVSEALSPGVKRPGRGTDHSPPTSFEVNNTWIYSPTPPYALMV
jgi:hypothetical protein